MTTSTPPKTPLNVRNLVKSRLDCIQGVQLKKATIAILKTVKFTEKFKGCGGGTYPYFSAVFEIYKQVFFNGRQYLIWRSTLTFLIGTCVYYVVFGFYKNCRTFTFKFC